MLLRLATISFVAVCACASAHADPLADIGNVRDGGAVARRILQLDGISTNVAGMRLTPGVAFGLRGTVRDNMSRSIAPALQLQIRQGLSMALLPAAGSGATMLVLQITP
ncbi:MAG TPA: hypothetical protein VFP68_10465 [Burkholderiaceae bacterium]|nr:hypothetical protein [Burkholderiaceae bacterium]